MTEQRTEYMTVQRSSSIDVMTLGNVLAKSGYFQDAKDAAQAVVKVLAGQEMGIGPIASMTGIHIVKGKPVPSANVMAAVVKASPKYDFRVVTLTDAEASIEFFERSGDGWVPIGTSTFTKADAKLAGTGNVDKFPRNMFYARAMSNGVKWYCPDVSTMPVYSPDEMGAEVDWETGEIVSLPTLSEVIDSEPVQQPTGNGADVAEHQQAFFAKVLEELPYYNHVNHIKATLRQLGFTGYKVSEEATMLEVLTEHASARADADFADEPGEGVGVDGDGDVKRMF